MGVKPKMQERKFRSNVNRQGALKKKILNRTDVKQRQNV